jgi:glycerol-3-phosphate acyltransferase PlsY
MGISLVMLPLETLLSLIVWFVAGKVIRISSLSSLVALGTLFGSSFYFSPEITHVPIGIISFLIFYKHIPNIERLFRGEEKRIV